MLERYTSEKMGKIWSEKHKYETWLGIESKIFDLCLKQKGIEIKGDRARYKMYNKRIHNRGLDIEEIKKIESVVNHDVLAFIRYLEKAVNEETKESTISGIGKFVHYGATSSDIVDTGMSLLMKEAIEQIESGIDNLNSKIYDISSKCYDLVIMGKTHGAMAEPTTVCMKMLVFYHQLTQNLEILKSIKENLYGKLSGSVGCYHFIKEEIEKEIISGLGLKPCPVSSQIIPRESYSRLIFTLANIGSILESLATEYRHLLIAGHLHRTWDNKPGSSSMPNKNMNPIGFEKVCGLSRILRGNVVTAMENINLWNERDISNSSVERIIIPESFILLDHILTTMEKELGRYEFDEDSIKNELDSQHEYCVAQGLMLELIDMGGYTREAIHLGVNVIVNGARNWNYSIFEYTKQLIKNNYKEAPMPIIKFVHDNVNQIGCKMLSNLIETSKRKIVEVSIERVKEE